MKLMNELRRSEGLSLPLVPATIPRVFLSRVEAGSVKLFVHVDPDYYSDLSQHLMQLKNLELRSPEVADLVFRFNSLKETSETTFYLDVESLKASSKIGRV